MFTRVLRFLKENLALRSLARSGLDWTAGSDQTLAIVIKDADGTEAHHLGDRHGGLPILRIDLPVSAPLRF